MGMADSDYVLQVDGDIQIRQHRVESWFHALQKQRRSRSRYYWLMLRLIGDGPVNRDAIGTKVVTTNERNIFLQESTSGISLGVGSERALHRPGTVTSGRGGSLVADGTSQSFSDVAVDRIWKLLYQELEE